MNKINTLTVVKRDHMTEEQYQAAIGAAVKVLLDNEYIMTVSYDCGGTERNVTVIKYNYANLSMGTDYPYWLSPEEEESVIPDAERENDGYIETVGTTIDDLTKHCQATSTNDYGRDS